MDVKKFLIASGNSTALIYNRVAEPKNHIITKLLKKVEQVGFASIDGEFPTLTMMGNEFCINATLAFASTLQQSGTLLSSGCDDPIFYSNEKNITTAHLSLTVTKEKNIILFNGIGFIFHDIKENHQITKVELARLCQKYQLPAFGGIIYKKNKIIPYVYVAHIQSFVKETACGSGSLAFSIFSGIREVIQPSGDSITIKIGKKYHISAPIKCYV